MRFLARSGRGRRGGLRLGTGHLADRLQFLPIVALAIRPPSDQQRPDGRFIIGQSQLLDQPRILGRDDFAGGDQLVSLGGVEDDGGRVRMDRLVDDREGAAD